MGKIPTECRIQQKMPADAGVFLRSRRYFPPFLDKCFPKIYNTGMKYIELTVHTTSEASELVADVMWQYTEGGVAVSDSRDVVALVKGENGVF